jgi:hypothetical protein
MSIMVMAANMFPKIKECANPINSSNGIWFKNSGLIGDL